MKNNTTMIKSMASLLLALGMSAMANAIHLSDQIFFSARMDGSQQVPAVTSNGKGVASLVLNATRDTLCVNIYMSGISEAVTGIHLHNGMAGATGGVAFDLSPYLNGNMVRAQITGASLTAALIQDMINANIYINAHTASNPNGEIRGQVKLETDYAINGMLTTGQQVTMPTSSATGVVAMNISMNKKTLRVMAVANNLSSMVDGAHIHYGAMGVDGPVAVNLSSMISGNTVQGNVDISSMPELLDSIMMGKAYLNLHTPNNPAGEIRAQLMMSTGINFDTWMTTGQQVTAPTGSSAMGTGYFNLSPMFDMLTFAVQMDGLTGAVAGAHFHNAGVGADGPVMTDLSMMVNGNMISGSISGTDLTNELITELLEGNIYLNIHTTMNAAGELRGQVYRLTREGYTLMLSGDQQVPAISSMAYGGGMASVNRDQTDVHYMVVLGDLSGPVDGAHFHNGLSGANGGVLYDLSPSFMQTNMYDAAFGYWTSTDGTPFTSAEAMAFRTGSVYLNVHTMANPNGEIRGQAERGAACDATAGIEEDAMNMTVSVYPNPASDMLMITSDHASINSMKLTDINGKQVQDITLTGNGMIDCSKLVEGIYFLQVEAGSNTSTHKVVISK